PVDLAFRIDEIEGIQDFPAVLALVSARPREAAVWARPFDEPVREEPLVRRAERGDHHRLVDVAFLLQGEEDLLHPRLVMRVCGVPVEVVPHAELLDVLLVEGMVSLSANARPAAFLPRAHPPRRAVHVAPADDAA